ncbi:SEC-C motif-containing protein [Thermoanaerobacter thermohydrosulfuricus]|uniref:SEC-C motif-containing protein n=1 Tax=Thermoanaerobacter thermohydrosulfuricus TaxID=1516 RepID=A0A1G7VUN1_THETY|nr:MULTISPECIES: SEC-C domain-containing protein [Thermoanaerobacter]SDG63248.1 SEC-C motif-containing protein [Thermoanaerobacter thermohydrosulfuricus]SFE54475.1 SEC-C motif-containing protein [Thermoanaerobacter thermohydrosulfuricus]
MSKIFDIDRNDECICGSGKKYKKCCLPNIEKIEKTLLKEMEKENVFLPHDYEFIQILSVMYGIKLDDKNEAINVEKLKVLLIKSLEERKQLLEKLNEENEDEITEELFGKIVNIFRTNKELKNLRIPVIFIINNVDLDNEEEMERVLDEISNTSFLEDYLLNLAYYLRTEKVNEEEMKNIFIWLSIAVIDKTYKIFTTPILEATEFDLVDGEDELEKVINDAEKLPHDLVKEKVMEIFYKYPIFAEYLSANMLMEMEDDLNYILDPEMEIEIPFYVFYIFYLKFLTKAAEFFKKKNIEKQEVFDFIFDEVIDEIFDEDIVAEKVYFSILDKIVKIEKTTKDNDLKEKLQNILEFLTIPTTFQISLIKIRFVISLSNYVNTLPQRIDDSNMILENLEQLLSKKFFNEYIAYLESKDFEEVQYLKQLYNKIEEQKAIIYDNMNAIVNALKGF